MFLGNFEASSLQGLGQYEYELLESFHLENYPDKSIFKISGNNCFGRIFHDEKKDFQVVVQAKNLASGKTFTKMVQLYFPNIKPINPVFHFEKNSFAMDSTY